MVLSSRREAIDLRNNISIEVHTASYRTVRGYTIVGAILDELAFWRSDESAEPDIEVVRALRPAMATVPGAMLLGISSPYSRRGVLWNAYRQHFGEDSNVLVWQTATELMNPKVDDRVISEAYRDDPVAAAAEYGADFRSDIESYITREAVEAVVVPDRRELPSVPQNQYSAFCDPSGGSSDSMTLAIAHLEKEVAVLDAVREVRPPFSPENVVAEFAQLMRLYCVRQVYGDRYAGEWPREQFWKHGVTYRPAEKPKSDLYRDILPLLNSKRVELLDHSVLVAQLCSLERRTSRGGRDSIDHPPRGRDDVANAVAGALLTASEAESRKARVERFAV
jgi:hypothetical protein